jgi:hypothetical protein
MTRIIIAGDSWGVYSYERGRYYPKLKVVKQKKKSKYVLYPGPGELLSEVTDTEIITTAGRGYSNTEALDALEKVVTKDDIVIFYQTGMLREVHKAHLAMEEHHATESFADDFTYYEDKFYERCKKIQAKSFTLIGGCVKVNVEKAEKNGINVLLPSMTSWMHPDFVDNEFDTTVYWLEYQYSCSDFKNAVIESHKKIEFWVESDHFIKRHPTVRTNRRLIKDILLTHITS